LIVKQEESFLFAHLSASARCPVLIMALDCFTVVLGQRLCIMRSQLAMLVPVEDHIRSKRRRLIEIVHMSSTIARLFLKGSVDSLFFQKDYFLLAPFQAFTLPLSHLCLELILQAI
jgi:hypothetical protein